MQIVRDGIVFVEDKPDWIKLGKTDEQVMKYISPIFLFYVLRNPNVDLSAKGIPLTEYGWTAPWRSPEYLNKKLKEASSSKCLFWASAKHNEMEKALRNTELFDLDRFLDSSEQFEECLVFYDGKKNQTLSVLYHIRNSICHGRYAVVKHKKCLWFVMEDVAGAKKNDQVGNNYKRLTARMLIQYKTLQHWINIIIAGPQV